MKRNMKKMAAFLLTVIMTLTMCVNVFAVAPDSTNKANITVKNVEAGLTVTAYQIVEANYSEIGFTGYSAVKGVTLADPLSPTSDEVTAIAKAITDGTLSLPTETLDVQADGSYVKSVAPGYWVVVVSGAGTKVYNPMLAGVYYSVSGSDDTLIGGTIDANANWTLNGTDLYAKSSEVTIEKTIVNSGNNNKGDDVAVGDTVTFQITTTIPDYSKEYVSAVFKFTDTLSEGFTPGAAPTVEGATSSWNGNVLTVDFASDYILANGGKQVVITYDAVLNEKAAVNFDANTNTVKLEYTNNPTTGTNALESKTYHYTFGIGVALGGTRTDTSTTITKTGAKTETTQTVEKLEGAEFTLTRADGKQYVAVSGKDGKIAFTGLDAGTYTLVETKAPKGYQLDSTPHTVVISATYNPDGTLNTYTIQIDDKITDTFTGTYNGDGTVTVTGSSSDIEIANTKLSSLPSTGGMGTYLFTIVGVVLMVAAAALLIVKRRHNAE